MDSNELNTNQTLNFFTGVNTRVFPNANINSNRFEVGESLAISSIAFAATLSSPTDLSFAMVESVSTASAFTNTLSLNLYIGNQRVIKDLDLNYSRMGIGEAYDSARLKNVIHLETPIVIPPQIEFYATIRLTTNVNAGDRRFYLILGGQGTLLNTKSNF